MREFWTGFEKRAFNLKDAKNVFQKVVKPRLVRVGRDPQFDKAVSKIKVRGQNPAEMKGFSALTPEQKKMTNLMAHAHEGDEAALRGSKSYQRFSSHFSPDILLRESNRVATLPKGMSPVGENYIALRNATGEASKMQDAARGFQYGKTRLSRHARKRIADIITKKNFQISKDLPDKMLHDAINKDPVMAMSVLKGRLKPEHFDTLIKRDPSLAARRFSEQLMPQQKDTLRAGGYLK